MMRGWWLLALCGCDKLFSVDSFPPIDAPAALPDPVAYYPMESVAATTVHCMPDASGHGHAGNCVAGSPLVVTGERGNAYKFDGVVHIHVGEDLSLDPAEGTVAFWAKLSTTSAGGCPVNRIHTGMPDNSWQICTYSDHVFFVAGGSVTAILMIPPEQWHHYALTYDESGVEAWFDGVSQGQMPGVVEFDTRDMVIGTDIDNGSPVAMYDGSVDELLIYDRVLPRVSIEQLATAP